MRYFDLHCDTVTARADGKSNTAVDTRNVSFDEYKQCYAVFQDDSLSGKAAFERAKQLLTFYHENINDFDNERCSSILTVENAVSFGDDLNNISFWVENKLKVCSLTWNGKNKLGFGSDFHGEGGLTFFGKDVLRELEKNNIVLDVSHLNDNGFSDVARISKKPFIATHSNCSAICPHKRNLSDSQIKEIINCGGLIGVNFYPLFLGKGNVFELVFEHIYRILELGGENAACFGSDFDGADMDSSLKGTEDVVGLYDYFKCRGFDCCLLDKIFFRNAENFFDKCFT